MSLERDQQAIAELLNFPWKLTRADRTGAIWLVMASPPVSCPGCKKLRSFFRIFESFEWPAVKHRWTPLCTHCPDPTEFQSAVNPPTTETV